DSPSHRGVQRVLYEPDYPGPRRPHGSRTSRTWGLSPRLVTVRTFFLHTTSNKKTSSRDEVFLCAIGEGLFCEAAKSREGSMGHRHPPPVDREGISHNHHFHLLLGGVVGEKKGVLSHGGLLGVRPREASRLL